MNRIQQLFKSLQDQENRKVLSIFFTAGFPTLESTLEILKDLEESEVDLIEIGIPFSDPLADGPVIQESSRVALENGMNLELLFEQLQTMRQHVSIPVILMGYFNPVFTYGVEKFVKQCTAVGVDGVILPDLPLAFYKANYQSLFEEAGLSNICLISPETSEDRIRTIDDNSNGFIYAVSTSSTTGNSTKNIDSSIYLKGVKDLKLENPVMTGFNIKDYTSFQNATIHTSGGIIGTAFMKCLSKIKDGSSRRNEIKTFISSIK